MREDTPLPKKLRAGLFPGSEDTFFFFSRFSASSSNKWEFWGMTQMSISHKKSQPESKHSSSSLPHLHNKVSQSPGVFYNPLVPKGLLSMLGKGN